MVELGVFNVSRYSVCISNIIADHCEGECS